MSRWRWVSRRGNSSSAAPPGRRTIPPSSGATQRPRHAPSGWEPEPGRFHLFAVALGEAAFISYDTGTGDQHVAMWPPAREFIRRATTATSVGDPEPARSLLTAG